MKKIYLLTFGWLLLSFGLVFSQDYLWPTDASHWMTSAFGEYRPRRLHAAIDIKTWNQTGYKVFAVRDGYIQRIRVSPFGYGKAIYLKLDTGEIVVYAHLRRFNKKLQRVVRREQQKNQRYRVDRYFSPDAFPVKKGEVLGFTGETGIGVPHLHFEMRDAANRPINPLLKGYKIDDRVPPIPTAISVIPLSFASRVDNDFKPKIFKLDQLAEGHYRIKNPISIEGEVGLAVAGYDMTGTVPNRFGLYELKLILDGRDHFSVTYNRFNYAHNRFVELDRDYRLYRQGKGKFYHLFLEPENKLTFYQYAGPEKGKLITSSRPGFPQADFAGTNDDEKARLILTNGSQKLLRDRHGRRLLASGLHTFKIILRDFFKNKTEIDGTLIAGKRFRIEPQFQMKDSLLVLNQVQFPGSIAPGALTIWQKFAGRPNHWALKGSYPFSDGVGSENNKNKSKILPIPLLSWQDITKTLSLKFSLIDFFGIASWPYFLNFPGKQLRRPFEVSLATYFYDDFLDLQISATQPLRKLPIVELTLPEGSTKYPSLFPKNPTTYVAPIPLTEVTGKGIKISAQAEGMHREVATDEIFFDNFPVRKGSRAFLLSPDSVMKIVFWENSLYRDLYGRINIDSTHFNGRDPDLVSMVYNAEPQDAPLNKGALISISYPSDFSDPTKLGIYYWSRKKWVFIDHKLDEEDRRVSARVFSLEAFALKKDVVAPVVRVRTPGEGQIISATSTIRIFARDDQSGFQSEESLQLFIDGRKAIAEYDPENHEISYNLRRTLEAGVHRLRFRATDQNGNVTTIYRTFRVQ